MELQTEKPKRIVGTARTSSVYLQQSQTRTAAIHRIRSWEHLI